MSEPLVRLENVRFAYGERAILRGISLSIPRGKVVAIMGGSGCGKTTLLRLIGGQERAVGGRVTVDGQDVAGLGRDALYALRRRMGMLFQFGALFTDMSVFDNDNKQISSARNAYKRVLTLDASNAQAKQGLESLGSAD